MDLIDRLRAAAGACVQAADELERVRAELKQRRLRLVEDRGEECTCRAPIVHSTDIDPPDGRILDKWCPIHGRDPDEAYEEMRERKWDR